MAERRAAPALFGGTAGREKARRSAAERAYGFGQVVVQIALRGLIILLAVSFQNTVAGTADPDAAGLKQGTATITTCSTLTWWPIPFDWGVTCRFDVRWQDGSVGRGKAETVYLGEGDVGRSVPAVYARGAGNAPDRALLQLDAPYAAVGHTIAFGGALFALLAPVWLPWRSWAERREVIRRRRLRMPPWLLILLGYGLAVGGSFGFVVGPPTAGLDGWEPLAWPPLAAVVAGFGVALWGFGASVSRRRRGHPVPGRPPLFVRWARFGTGVGLLAVGLIAVSGILGGGLGQRHSAVVVTRLTVPVVLVVLGLSALVVWSHQVRLSRSAADAWQSSPYLEAAADEAVRERRDAGPEPAPPLH